MVLNKIICTFVLLVFATGCSLDGQFELLKKDDKYLNNTQEHWPTLKIDDVTFQEQGNSGTRFVQLHIESSFSATEPIQFFYTTALDANSATPGIDFVFTMSSATIAVGEKSAVIEIPVYDDTIYEMDETFRVLITGGTGYQEFGSKLSATVTIKNDDPMPVLSVASNEILEGNSGTTEIIFQATLSGASAYPVVLNYSTVDGTAIKASDYQDITGTVTIAPGSTQANIAVNILTDTIYEDDEVFNLKVKATNVANENVDVIAVGKIKNDDDPPILTLTGGTATEVTGAEATLIFPYSLNQASSLPVSFRYNSGDVTAIAGDDYEAVSGDITIPAGTTSGTIQVKVLDDNIYEPNETFKMTLTNTTGLNINDSTLEAVGTIVSNELQPTLSIDDKSLEESDSTLEDMVFRVTLSHPSSVTVTVDYSTEDVTALAGADYVANSGTLTFVAGVLFHDITVQIKGDTQKESAETFKVKLQDGGGYQVAGSKLSGTGTISDSYFNAVTYLATGAAANGSVGHTCGITKAKDVICWGDNSLAQLGNPSSNSTTLFKVQGGEQNPADLRNIEQLAVGRGHSCALDSASAVYCWGTSLGLGAGAGVTTDQMIPRRVVTGDQADGSGFLTNVTAIGSGYDFSCALTSDKSVYCWGAGSYLGTGGSTSYRVPKKVLAGQQTGTYLSNVTQIAVGYRSVCAIDSSKNLYCWGDRRGTGINNSTGTAASPVRTLGGEQGGTYLVNVVSVMSGWNTACAIDSNANIYCWGQNATALAASASMYSPSRVLATAQVGGTPDSYLTGVSLFTGANGSGNCVVIAADGTLKCWGGAYGTYPTKISSTRFNGGFVKDIKSINGSIGTFWMMDDEGHSYGLGVNFFNAFRGGDANGYVTSPFYYNETSL